MFVWYQQQLQERFQLVHIFLLLIIVNISLLPKSWPHLTVIQWSARYLFGATAIIVNYITMLQLYLLVAFLSLIISTQISWPFHPILSHSYLHLTSHPHPFSSYSISLLPPCHPSHPIRLIIRLSHYYSPQKSRSSMAVERGMLTDRGNFKVSAHDIINSNPPKG